MAWKNESSSIDYEERASWDARKGYNEFLIEVIQDMYDAKRERNFLAYIDAFEQTVLMTSEIFKSWLKKGDEEILDLTDVKNLQQKMKHDPLDSEIPYNKHITNVIMKKLKAKEKLLYSLLIKSKLLMPIIKEYNTDNAILGLR